MKRLVLIVIALAIAGGAGFFAYRSGLVPLTLRSGSPVQPGSEASSTTAPPTSAASPSAASPSAGAPSPGAASPDALVPGQAPAAASPDAPPAAAAQPAPVATAAGGTPPSRTDPLAIDMGGHVESVTSEYDARKWSAWRLLDTSSSGWDSAGPVKFPQEIVFSFYHREPVLITAVLINPNNSEPRQSWSKEIEIWTSRDSATSGYTKATSVTLVQENGDQPFAIGPVEAKYLKLIVLSNYGATDYTALGKVKVVEGRAQGYRPLAERSADLAAVLSSGSIPMPAAVASPSTLEAFSSGSCGAPSAPTAGRHGESRNVLIVDTYGSKVYPGPAYRQSDQGAGRSTVFTRAALRVISPIDARAIMLSDAVGVDTVVLSELCEIKTDVSEGFKRALAGWVARGNKLIIHDSDRCGSNPGPDYSFLPYRFATSNPGARGASSDRLLFVEENRLANARKASPGFLDIEAWLKGEKGNTNELGDSNTIREYDPHWCGVLFGTNVNKVNGFQEAYAHYGRGIIIYNGFDHDQSGGPEYHRLLENELELPFDPDGLSCSARLGDFVVSTEQRLKTQPMIPGRTYTYPLTLLSNQGYKGRVMLSASASPAEPTLGARLVPDAVDLDVIGNSSLTLTTSASTGGGPRTIAVRGVDASGNSSVLCLNLEARTSGALQVTTNFQKPTKAAKNLEIILDLSGSMKQPLARSTRIGTAREVLKAVLARIPDDFNVGLRLYGHRYASTDKRTCTDTEVVVPVGKLDRSRLLSIIGSTNPRGETPLVYSVLQTIGDLTPLGGGEVILITDGEESCGGDAVAAAKTLRDSGLGVRLDIVGFTLQGKQTQQALSTFASATGGHFYTAQNGEALARALLMAAVDRLPYTVFDAAGKEVATGEAGGEAQELPPGRYKVVVTAGDQQLVADGVEVVQGRDATVTIELKGDQFVVRGGR